MRASVAPCRFKVSHFLDRWLVQEWVWGLGGAEVAGRNRGGAWGSLGHRCLWVIKRDGPQSCRHCLHSFLPRTLPHGSGETQ